MPIEKEKNIGQYTAFSKNALKGNDPRKNRAIQAFMKSGAAKFMNDPTEQRHLLREMQKEAKGGNLSEEGLRNAFGRIMAEKSGDMRLISEQEAKGISREFFGKRKGYNIISKNNASVNAAPDRLATLKQKMAESKNNSPVVSPRGGSSPMVSKPGSSSGMSFFSRPKF